jgi:hypothetical protein
LEEIDGGVKMRDGERLGEIDKFRDGKGIQGLWTVGFNIPTEKQ